MQTWEDGAARAAQLLIWELILQGTLSLVLLPYLEAVVSGQHLSQQPHVHLLRPPAQSYSFAQPSIPVPPV